MWRKRLALSMQEGREGVRFKGDEIKLVNYEIILQISWSYVNIHICPDWKMKATYMNSLIEHMLTFSPYLTV